MSYSLEKQLSRRVIVLNSVIFFVVLVAFNVSASLWLIHEEDEIIQTKADVIAHLISHVRDEINFSFSAENMPEFENDIDPEYFQIWINNNEIFEKSRSLEYEDLQFRSSVEPVEFIENIILPDGRRGRMIQLTFYLEFSDKDNSFSEAVRDKTLITLVVAKEREEVDLLINAIHMSTILLILIVIIILNYMVKKTVRKNLMPLTNINNQIKLLSADKLNNEIKLADIPDELNDFVLQFNSLLSRLDLSFNREKRFSSDVAHELRTPVAELLTMSEVALKWPDDLALAQDFYSGVYDSSRQMMLLVNNLLALARCENTQYQRDLSIHGIKKIVNDCLQRYKILADEKGLVVECSINSDVLIETEIVEFEQIINNLVSNAVTYSVCNSPLFIDTVIQGEFVSLSIQNTTEQLVDKDLDMMFDRLWRKSSARSSSEHSGLGLAIVKAYAKMLNLDITTELPGGKIFIVSVSGIRCVERQRDI
ncbi:hypothetical protein MNBD_GAMMA10-695 [hydrothermal vent metagenome]|uniref:histidine kinase n=1 Tax=hydrothermal vent metagenome TaxID=652676 RepID=A0A3B0XS41_9ZZZZ